MPHPLLYTGWQLDDPIKQRELKILDFFDIAAAGCENPTVLKASSDKNGALFYSLTNKAVFVFDFRECKKEFEKVLSAAERALDT